MPTIPNEEALVRYIRDNNITFFGEDQGDNKPLFNRFCLWNIGTLATDPVFLAEGPLKRGKIPKVTPLKEGIFCKKVISCLSTLNKEQESPMIVAHSWKGDSKSGKLTLFTSLKEKECEFISLDLESPSGKLPKEVSLVTDLFSYIATKKSPDKQDALKVGDIVIYKASTVEELRKHMSGRGGTSPRMARAIDGLHKITAVDGDYRVRAEIISDVGYLPTEGRTETYHYGAPYADGGTFIKVDIEAMKKIELPPEYLKSEEPKAEVVDNF